MHWLTQLSGELLERVEAQDEAIRRLGRMFASLSSLQEHGGPPRQEHRHSRDRSLGQHMTSTRQRQC